MVHTSTSPRSLSIIPNEIYLEILDSLEVELYCGLTEREYKDILANLALVCRFFCAICLPRIFKSMTFDGEATDQDEGPKSAVFCRQLKSNYGPARLLASYVKECKFKNWKPSSSGPNWAFSAFYKIYTQALHRFTNLDSLFFAEAIITSDHTKSIGILEKLTYLSFYGCTFDNSVREITIPPKLESFTFLLDARNTPGSWDIDIFIDPLLNSSIRSLKTNDVRLLHSVLKHPEKIGLEYLEISHLYAILDLLLEYLKHSVSIKHLAIGFGASRLKAEHAHRHTLSCCGTVPYSILEVYQVDTLNIFTSPFGRDAYYAHQSVEKLLHLKKYPSLRNLRFEGFVCRFDLLEQKKLISELTSGPFPGLTHARIEEYVEWRREDYNTAPWRPFVPQDFQVPFKAYLELEIIPPTSLTDHDCFFEKQLSSLDKDEYPRC